MPKKQSGFGKINYVPLWPKPVPLICIHYDNQAAIVRAHNMIYNDKSRHIRRKYNTARQFFSNEIISLDFMKSKENIIDPMTNGLSRE